MKTSLCHADFGCKVTFFKIRDKLTAQTSESEKADAEQVVDDVEPIFKEEL